MISDAGNRQPVGVPKSATFQVTIYIVMHIVRTALVYP
jgi:hypothetical protein